MGKNPHRRPFHSLPTDSAPHSKKNAPKFSLLERFFWPVQRPNPGNISKNLNVRHCEEPEGRRGNQFYRLLRFARNDKDFSLQ